MLRLATRQRQALSVTVRELANYGAAALIFGQFVSERAVSWSLAFAWCAAVACFRRSRSGHQGE